MSSVEITVRAIALSRADAAAALGMSASSFKRHVEADLRVIRRGHLRLFPIFELERWAAENAERPPGAAAW